MKKKLFDKNPAHRIATKMFEKIRDEEEHSATLNEKGSIVKYTKEEKTRINIRAEIYNPLNRSDLQNKISTDIKILNDINSKKSQKDSKANIPRSYNLYQNYPNPFNPKTTIKYDIPKNIFVTIKIYDVLGKEIFSTSEFNFAGSYELEFDASNYASGLYFYRIETGTFAETKKMVLIK